MNLGYQYRYDKSPKIGIDIGMNFGYRSLVSVSDSGMILVCFGINVKVSVSGMGITSGIGGKWLISELV